MVIDMSVKSEEAAIKAFNLSVRSVMRQAVTVSPSESISNVMFKLVDNDIGAVVVVEKEEPVGIITEKDVIERAIMCNKNVYDTIAASIMSKPVISIEADCSIKEALELMRKHKIRRLAVIGKTGIMAYGALIGVVTERRVLAGFLSELC